MPRNNTFTQGGFMKKLPTQFDNSDIGRGLTWKTVIKKTSKYRFYFAFENGIHCRDYLSEKFWRNALEAELVPIVFGVHPDDIKALAPPHSYIHTEDYENPKDLIDYLEYLVKNDTAYMEYHSWRLFKPDLTKAGEIWEDKRNCGICKLMQKNMKENYPVRMIKSVASWWWLNSHDNKCLNLTSSDIPKYFDDIVPPVSMENNWFDEL